MTESTEQRRLTFELWQSEATDLEGALRRLQERFGRIEPRLHAFVDEAERFDRLHRDARRLEQQALDAAHRGPLQGVPVGIKDVFHVDGLETRAGSRLPPEVLGGPEADCVRRLRAAGCLVLGKTASTEFAYFAPGPTVNPHDVARTPGGSSSGSAAAVAAGLCPLALGTQTIGSISRPASFCGVVGFKPSFGRIPVGGMIALAPSLDHVGTFTSCVVDAARAAAVLCDPWRPEAIDGRPILGIPEGPYLQRASGEGQMHFRMVCDRLASAGFEIRAVPAFADLATIEERHQLILAAEAASVHAAWYGEFRGLYHAKTIELIEAGLRVPAAALAAALPGRLLLRDELTDSMDRHQIDLWLSPAARGPAPVGLESTGDPIMSLPWTHAGLPTVSLPADRTAVGLPMGLQIAGGWNQDERLLAWATILEEALRSHA